MATTQVVVSPLMVPWHGGSIPVRHDDDGLTEYSSRLIVIRSAVALVSGAEGPRTILGWVPGTSVTVLERPSGLVVALRRRW